MIRPRVRRFLARGMVLLAAVALLSGMAWIVRGRSSAGSAPLTPTAESIPVKIFEIETGQFEQTRSLTGLVVSRYVSELAFRVGGKIEARLVNVGDQVASGDPLFRLELNDYRLQLEAAEADLASALAALKQAANEETRMRSLRGLSAVSADEYDRSLAARDIAKARYTSAQRALELARNRFTYGTLKAPDAGVVTAVMAERGQVVQDGRAVVQLTQGDTLEMAVGVPEKFLAVLRDAPAEISFWAFPDVLVKGQLRELSPTSDSAVRTYEARYSISDPPKELQLGMSATLHLRTPQEAEGISIPASALVGRYERFVKTQNNRDQTPFVWKIVDKSGRIEALPVEVLSYGENEVFVRGELHNGDRIVAAGVQKLDSGMSVQRWEELK